MDVPADLTNWEGQMTASPDSTQVLQNLRDENCLDATDEDQFWDRVRGSDPATTSTEAWNSAKWAVWDDPSLNYKRSEVPPSRFANLVRYGLPEKFPDMFPNVDISTTGLTEDDLETATPDILTDLIEEAELESEIRFRYLVWAAEESPDFDPRVTPDVDLVNRLGLPTHHDRLLAGHCCVQIRYEKSQIPAGCTLHVPSSLDGVDNPQFRPATDCGSEHGLTEPLDPSAGDGFPEAVHRGCNVPGFQIRLAQA